MAELTLQHLMAASALIVKLERIASSGVLSPDDEFDARLLIVRAGKAFNLDSIAERPVANVIQIGDHDPEYAQTIETVAREMGANS